MSRFSFTLLGSAILVGLATPALANDDDRRGRYDQHDRIERKHDRSHDRLERKHDRAHAYGVSRRQHRRVHNRLERKHDRNDARIERKHDRQHDRDGRYY